MVFFHKNKSRFRIRQKRYLFVALFLLSISFLSIISFVFHAKAENVPIRSIEIFSEHADFENSDPGAWKITKSADWTSKTTAKITFEIDSVPKLSGDDRDIIIVLDNSSSMNEALPDSNNNPTTKLQAIKQNADELIRNTLVNQESQIAIVSFATDAEIVSPFSNDSELLIAALDSITANGSTNYYKALAKVEEVLETYQPRNDKDIIVLFITDGVPVKQTTLEITKYYELKNRYDNLVINAVQYAMGDTIIPQLEKISDNQFIVQDAAQLDKSLFEAAFVPYYYSSFNITDYIDTDYWTFDSASASLGTTTTNGDSTIISWDLGKYFRPGQESAPKLTIHLQLKPEFHESDDIFPTNTKETINSAILDGATEDITSTKTPVIQHKYDVVYDANLPTGCSSSINLPDPERYFVFDTVEVYDINLSCEGYNFKGWEVSSNRIAKVNDEHFIMPSSDVIIRAIWTNPSISKSMEGSIHERITATLLQGNDFNNKIKRISGDEWYWNYTINHWIERIDRTDHPLGELTDDYLISSRDSQAPIYAWFVDGTIYYYTEADQIYMNQDSSSMFHYITELKDIDIIREWDISNVTNMSGLFSLTAIDNFDIISDWDVSNVTNMNNMFWSTDITNTDAFANWNVANVTDISHMFGATYELTDITGLSGWNVSNVKDISSLFQSSKITNVDALANWDVSSVENMSGAFRGANQLTDINGLANWNTSALTDISYLFYEASNIANIDALSNWNTSSITNMNAAFYGLNKITNLDALQDWDVSKTKTMASTFSSTTSLTDINALSSWNTSNVENMSYLFSSSTSLETLNGISGWDTSNVTNLAGTFKNMQSLKNLDDLSSWNTSKVTSLKETFGGGSYGIWFSGARSLQNIDGITNWDTSNVTDMSYLFAGATSLPSVSALSNWYTSKVTNMTHVFFNMDSLLNLHGVENWDISKVTNLSHAFQDDGSLTDISALSNWNTSNVTNIQFIFSAARSLLNLNGLSNWNMSKVTNMQRAFGDGGSSLDLSGISSWDVSNVTDMSLMFCSARVSNVAALQNWQTTNVKNMSNMFSNSELLNDLTGLQNWDTSNVTTMNEMFYNNKSLTSLNGLSEWNTSNVQSMANMFKEDHLLSDISAISNWQVQSLTNTNSMFYKNIAITDLSPLENWDPINLENMTNMFYEIPESVTRPSWYNL